MKFGIYTPLQTPFQPLEASLAYFSKFAKMCENIQITFFIAILV